MFKVLLTNRAVKQIKSLPAEIKTRVKEKLIELQKNPFSGDVRKMKVKPDRYRFRIGDYRIIFSVDKNEVAILVLTVRHRKDVYK